MHVGHERKLSHIDYGLGRALDVRSGLRVLVLLELVALVTVAQTNLETKVGEVAEHLSVPCVEDSEGVRHEQCGLRVGRIECHPVERHAVLDADHGIVVDLEDPVYLDRVQIDVRILLRNRQAVSGSHGDNQGIDRILGLADKADEDGDGCKNMFD